MENKYNKQERYDRAFKKVKRIKRFYTHAILYVIVNLIIIIINLNGAKLGKEHFHIFMPTFFWGLGLLAHGAAVFLPNTIMGSSWEKRKIRELMEKEKNSNGNWK
ncbi:2TM domain-containing protein [Flavobacterium chuncheonense]|uniref:2TM domain-containing protein n=1 Tax=Flavobacterium chuncheonense TaxID=2026653 RepID=A0ABW5YR98_9FLAO